MLTIVPPTDFGRLTDLVDKQLPYAAAVALNLVAQDIVVAEQHEMRDVFDRPRPTPYTLSGVAVYKGATKRRLSAVVWLKDYATSNGVPASKFLAPQIRGGSRRLKKSEKALRSAGVLPSDMFAVPGKAAKLDAYGNMDRGQIRQIISYFRGAELLAGHLGNTKDKTRQRLAKGNKKKGIRGFEYFVGRPADGKLPMGVWQRFGFGALGSAIKPVLIFIDKTPRYKAIYDFDYVAEITNKARFRDRFTAALAEARRTAR